MNKKSAYAEGKKAGYNIAAYAEFDEGMDYDEMLESAFEAEEIARQFTPFEFLAHDINASREPDGLWEEYERGVSVGIEKGLKQRFGL